MKRILLCFILAVGLAANVYASPTVDLTAPYDIPTADELTSALLYELKPYAKDYLDAANKYGINVYFLVSKDALESGWGRYRAAPNNLGGWTDDYGEQMAFDSVEAYIDHSARNLRDMYLTPRPPDALPDDKTGKYHEGYTLTDVGVHYNGSDAWVEAVAGIWAKIEWRIAKYSAEREGDNENG